MIRLYGVRPSHCASPPLQACTYLDAGFSKLKYCLLAAAFILVTPVGIGAPMPSVWAC